MIMPIALLAREKIGRVTAGYLHSELGRSHVVCRAADSTAAAIQHGAINLSRPDVPVTEQLLNRADVVSGLKQMGGELCLRV
jgi:hypothetical protein